MSDTTQTVDATVAPKARRHRKTDDTAVKTVTRRRSTRSGPDFTEFKTWLTILDAEFPPTLHINGAQFQNSVLVVDFGQPLRPVKLTTEQSSELVTRIRDATKLVIGKEVSVRVSNDSQTGVWWASLI